MHLCGLLEDYHGVLLCRTPHIPRRHPCKRHQGMHCALRRLIVCAVPLAGYIQLRFFRQDFRKDGKASESGTKAITATPLSHYLRPPGGKGVFCCIMANLQTFALIIRYRKVPKQNLLLPAAGGVIKNIRAAKVIWTNPKAALCQVGGRISTHSDKPLLERIIKASSDKGDIVLDPFCGCGTALDAAQRLGRRWIGIDAAVSAGAVMMELRESGQGGLEENRNQVNWRMISGDKQMPVRNDDGKTAIEYIPPKEPRRRLTAEERNAFLDDACKDGGGVCVGCGTKEHRDNLQVDHKDAFSKGGGNAFDNLQLLCDKCNGTKGTKTTEELWLILYETGRAISGDGAKYIVKALQGNLAK